MIQLEIKKCFASHIPLLALVTGYMLITAAFNTVKAKEAGIDPAAKAEVESILRLHIGESRSHISGLLSQMKDLEQDIAQQEKEIGLRFKVKRKPGLMQNIKDKTKNIKDKFIK